MLFPIFIGTQAIVFLDIGILPYPRDIALTNPRDAVLIPTVPLGAWDTMKVPYSLTATGMDGKGLSRQRLAVPSVPFSLRLRSDHAFEYQAHVMMVTCQGYAAPR